MARIVAPRRIIEGAPEVHALLGPTNTGKTHRAIERMLQYSSGMMGLPLRLLAREVYDRLTVRVGEQFVALVTGEERRIPRAPRYWICTVEAMPLDREVEFLAIDEVQLAADPNRGHVYTDRLLHARGTAETWFCGSDAIGPLLRRLVPTTQADPAPRLSRLSWAGYRSLKALPPRSAIVAFRAERVYALAERIRARSGGAAVVMGALSPRTRNLQVALFQSGEVPYLVATDAIGMGLNLDIDHVAFADLDKFDGTKLRPLRAMELGQIAGRAGRYQRDGTFGTTDTAPEMDPGLIRALQEHRYPALKTLWWRNSDVDTSTVATVLRSLAVPPPLPVLERARDEDDQRAFEALSRRPAILERATTPDRVALLWEVCKVPDYRKLLVEAHPDLLERVYLRLVDHGRLAASWIHQQLDHLDRVDGELDALTTRLSFIRTWAYIGNRARWIDAPEAVQAHTHAIEERLSTALHTSLTERFIDRRALVMAGARGATVTGDRVSVGDIGLGALRGLGFVADSPASLPLSVRATVSAALDARVHACVQAPFEAFSMDARGQIRWEDEVVARLAAGPDLREPLARIPRSDWLGPAALTQLQRRFTAWTRDWIEAVLAPLRGADVPRGPARGVLYALESGLGTIPVDEVADLLPDLDRAARNALTRAGVRFGVDWVYALPMLERTADRVALVTAARGGEPIPLPEGPVAVRPRSDVPWPTIGYIPLGPALFRVDVYEASAARIRALTRGGAFTLPADLPLGPDPSGVMRAAGYVAVEERWVRDRRGPGRGAGP